MPAWVFRTVASWGWRTLVELKTGESIPPSTAPWSIRRGLLPRDDERKHRLPRSEIYSVVLDSRRRVHSSHQMAPSAPTETELPVSIVMERRIRQRDRWHFVDWKAVGVLTGREHTGDGSRRRVIHEDEESRRVLWAGFVIRLIKDGAESYWANLMAGQPSLFVVCRRNEESDEPEPFLVTVNYDEIIGYQEVDDDVYRLPLPKDIYQWLERYVVNNYVPRETKKRKRTNWSETSDVQAPPSQRRH